MKRACLTAVCLLSAALASVPAAAITLSVSDFRVESDNAAHKYLGKGLARLVAAELARSKQVDLVEREQMQRLLEEQELSLSDLADDERQLEIGRMLAAQHIVFGEVIDLGGPVLLSLRMSDTATGKVEWQETTTEKLESYDYIGAFFARSILAALGAPVEKATEQKVARKEVKDAQAIVTLSAGIDALDRGQKDRARQAFERVKRIDPRNEVALLYLSRLGSATPKFRVESEYYAPTFNPAYLGLLQADSAYAWQGQAFTPPDANSDGGQTVGGIVFKEYPSTSALGYSLPLGERLGLSVEYNHGGFDRMVSNLPPFILGGVPESEMHPFSNTNGGSLGLGMRLTDRLAAGVSARLSNHKPGEAMDNPVTEELYYNLAAGVVLLGPGERWVVDLQAAWTSLEEWYVDPIDDVALRGGLPLSLDGTFILSLLDRRLYLALKGIGDLYLDERGGHALRAIPIVEFRPWSFLSLRAGYEYSHLSQAGEFSVGYGFLGGASVRVWKLELNANYTLRQKPARMLPGYLIDTSTLLVGLTYEPGLMRR